MGTAVNRFLETVDSVLRFEFRNQIFSSPPFLVELKTKTKTDKTYQQKTHIAGNLLNFPRENFSHKRFCQLLAISSANQLLNLLEMWHEQQQSRKKSQSPLCWRKVLRQLFNRIKVRHLVPPLPPLFLLSDLVVDFLDQHLQIAILAVTKS